MTHKSNKFDENINTIDTIKTIDTIRTNRTNRTNRTMVVFNQELTKTNDYPTSWPLGPEALGESQEAEGVMESAQILTLADEQRDLKAQGEWIQQHWVDYVKVSVYPTLDQTSHFTSFKCQYGLKLANIDLRRHQYTAKLTNRHNDYLGYARSKWSDADTWYYPTIAATVKQHWKFNEDAYVGRGSRNVGLRKTKHKMPNLGYTTVMINYDTDEDEWVCNLWHHDFHKRMSIPNNEWVACYTYWVREHGIKKEFNKKVPPMVAFEWRNLI